MMKKAAVLCFAMGMLALTSAAERITPQAAVDMLGTTGSEEIELTWLSEDAAQIDAKYESYFYSIRMTYCGDVSGCGAAIMFATFRMPGAPDLEMYRTINAYNDTTPFGRAFLLEPGAEDDTYAVGVDYVLDLSNEGRLDRTDVEMFADILDTFVIHMSETDGE